MLSMGHGGQLAVRYLLPTSLALALVTAVALVGAAGRACTFTVVVQATLVSAQAGLPDRELDALPASECFLDDECCARDALHVFLGALGVSWCPW